MGLTHVGVICDVPVVQPLLPQILIAPKNVLTKRDLAAVRAAMPEPIYVIHKKTKWVNSKILVWLMQMIHWSLRHVRGLYDVVIMLDVLAVHFCPELLQCMDTLSFRYMFIPAKLTWLIQPCDTHCFALYKRFLKLIVLRHRARSRFSEVPAVPVWFQFIADTIVHHMNQRSWVAAFRENGFGDSQMQVSAFIKRHLASTTFYLSLVFPLRVTYYILFSRGIARLCHTIFLPHQSLLSKPMGLTDRVFVSAVRVVVWSQHESNSPFFMTFCTNMCVS